MKKNRLIITIASVLISVIMLTSTISLAGVKAQTIQESGYYNPDFIQPKRYHSELFVEGIDILPMRGSAVGVNVGFIGGTVDIPFDATTFPELTVFSFTVSNQKLWRSFNYRRLWDYPDGAILGLHFKGGSTSDALEDGRAIAQAIYEKYGIRLALVYGDRDEARDTTWLLYQGRVSAESLGNFTTDFVDAIPDDGFGAGVTESVLNSAPIKAMSYTIIKTPVLGQPGVFNWEPFINAAWVDPDGLDRSGSIVDMYLTNIMPDLTDISGAADANASVVTMNLPYVVDVLEIDPPTDNLYPHLKGRFEWVIKVDIDFLNLSIDNHYADIHVKYDLNILDLKNYPQVVGELSVSQFPIYGGDDLIYTITWENVDDTETAYNITLGYGEFVPEDLQGWELPVNNPEIIFNPAQTMYVDAGTQILTDTEPAGEYLQVDGWFYWNDTSDLLADGQIVNETFFEEDLFEILYYNETFLEVDPYEFTPTTIDNVNGTFTLSTVIPELGPGATASRSFKIKNIPDGSFTPYNATEIGNTVQIEQLADINYEQLLITLFSLAGLTMHIPEDNPNNAFVQEEVIGAPFYYNDNEGKQFLGMTNGLVIQLYDDEAVLIGKTSLDKDVYRFGENVTMTLELQNIGDALATDINYQFHHGFVGDNFELEYIRDIPGSSGTIDEILPGEAVNVTHVHKAISHIGLHPVFATFGYTSQETFELPLFFGTYEHEMVYSSLDFGLILPPVNKEGTTEPTYAIPEVEVNTTLIGYTNETQIGDTLTLRSEITNVGDDATNILFVQFLPDQLGFMESGGSITREGVEITNYEYEWFRGNQFIPETLSIYRNKNLEGERIGLRLDINQTIVIEVQVRVKGSGNIYIPPTQIRYNTEYEIPDTKSINERPDEEAAATGPLDALGIQSASAPETGLLYGIMAEGDVVSEVTTNSWGSYSDGLSIVIEGLSGFGWKFFFIGLGLIAVTGVAVLIYFRANGKKH